MLAQRILQQSSRRLLTRQATSALSRTTTLSIASRFAVQQRNVETTAISSNDAASNSILEKQRLNRPVSPHLAIYKPQITWYLSGLNRLTGCILSGGFYIFGAAYLVAPLFGWHIESQAMAAAFASWPIVLKFLAKYTISLPFTFHSFNGIRHLIWDTTSMITNKQVQQTGWTVVGLTFASSLVLALM